ncbi:MAG: hypothetical protein MJK18_03380, partial [Bdellovibrionales bacterium]|nr:hypothetical protein [Bdellovibrionales bacterium]
SGYFEKNIVTDHLDSLLQSSGRAIAGYIQSQGVQLYRVKEKSQSECKYFAFLGAPTEEAQTNWSNSANYDDEGFSFLLGLFTTYYVPTGPQKYKIEEPTIMVREDTAKWTLLHEYSHYLFAEARTRGEMEPRQILSEQYYDAFNEYSRHRRQFNNNPSRQNARRLIRSLEELYEIKHDLDQAGPLEEFTVEAMMFDRLRDGQLGQVDADFDLRNALGYMNSNRKMVIKCYRRVAEVADGYAQTFSENSWDNLEQRATRFADQVKQTRSFINGKMTEAVDYYNAGLETTRLMTVESAGRKPDGSFIEHHHYDITSVRNENRICENKL